jgi:hypothetical protein
MSYLGVVAAIALLAGSDAVAQQVLWRVVGSGPYALLGGPGVIGMGDVDGDRIPDFAAASSPGGNLPQLVQVMSGATGQVIWSYVHPVAGLRFAQFIHGGGDINGDGFDDLVVGCPDYQDASGNVVGADFLMSGVDGQFLRQRVGLVSAPLPGLPGPIIGDVDADGFDDYISYGSTNPLVGAVSVRSGRTSSVLHSWSSVLDAPGGSIALGDVNGDGYDDILLSESGCSGSAFFCRGAIACYSGLTGAMFYRVYGDSTAQADFLAAVGWTSAGADVNGDGVPDFSGSADTFSTTAGPDRGMVRTYSGADGSVLWTRRGTNPRQRLGISVAMGDDWNGDGRADVLALRYVPDQSVEVLSGVDGTTLQVVSPTGVDTWSFPAMTTMGDVNGDGYRELLFSGNRAAWPQTFPGVVYVISIGSGVGAYRFRSGRPCAGSNGHLPRIKLATDPRLGTALDLRLRGSVPGRLALLLLGAPTNVDLTVLGAPDCRLLVDPWWISGPLPVNNDGMSSIGLFVPPIPALSGFTLEAQWGVLDPTANALGASLSDAMLLKVGL